MKKIASISRITVLLMAFWAFFAVSCEKPSGETPLEVSLKNTSVTSGKGQQFVSVRCSGDWTLSLAADEGEVDWAGLSVTSGKGDKSNVILTYQANTGEDSRELRVVLASGSRSVECSMVQLAAGERPEEGPDEDPQPVPDLDLTKTGWLELPAMDNPDLGYYSHSFQMNGKTYRNYSFGWSQDDLVAVWVAYPLCKFYTNKTVGRTDAWAYDPLLGSAYSSAPFGGYGGSYARGHQLPSADRLCCKDANVQTFYGTNLTPQLNGHNEGIWQALEDRVRTIANNSDTTYVVTGCMVRNPIGTTTDSDGKEMSVPSHYFKALLRYSKASTLGQWSAAGFYLEHRNYSKGSSGYDFKAVSMSIDELEEKTGLDFFVNLPAKVGEEQAAKLEAQDPANSSVWW